MKVPREMLSSYQNKIKKNNTCTEKLVFNQLDKQHYIIEGTMLDWYLDHGMKLTRSPECPTGVYKKLEFKKSTWLKDFILFNIEKIAEAKRCGNSFGDTFFKLMNNAFYGKTLENVRNRKNIIITSDGEKFKLEASKITYDTSEDFGNNVIAIHKKNNKILFDKFNYI